LGGLAYQLQWALWIRSALASVRGDAAEVRRLEAECRPMLEALAEDDLIRPTGLCNLAAHRAEEDPEGCIREMVEAAGHDLERLDPTWSTWLLLVLVRAALALGRGADAEHWAEVIERRASRYELPVGAARAKAARAELALAGGDPETAATLALEAAAEQESLGARIDELPARLCAGRALAAAGRAEEAEAELRRVAAEAERRTAWRFRDAAAAELRRLGVRLPGAEARRSGDPAELTDREREIASLVAEGRSNKQVAAALFLSEKTIEHHLSRVYGKLGVRSRTELAAAFARDGR
jgi:DNA-binding NarL/FixJ family response regulator